MSTRRVKNVEIERTVNGFVVTLTRTGKGLPRFGKRERYVFLHFHDVLRFLQAKVEAS